MSLELLTMFGIAATILISIFVMFRGLRADVKSDIAGLHTELKEDIQGLRCEIKNDIEKFECRLSAEIHEVRAAIQDNNERTASVEGQLSLLIKHVWPRPAA